MITIVELPVDVDGTKNHDDGYAHVSMEFCVSKIRVNYEVLHSLLDSALKAVTHGCN